MQVRIYKPAKNAMQSVRGKTREWVLEFEQATPRRPEPLMGWTSAGDTLNQVCLRFASRDEAVAFAERKGLAYSVEPDHARRVRPRNYADNFKPRPI
ncbi:MAG: ETC complex I subunit [Alphaproteobacteria bacterium]